MKTLLAQAAMAAGLGIVTTTAAHADRPLSAPQSGKAAAAATARATITVQAGAQNKKISTDLFGIFFEDINYAADGGLYAELVQNRSFEYSEKERRDWTPLTSWELVERGGGKGKVAVQSAISVHANNPQYALLTVEQGGDGVGLRNQGFDGITLKAGDTYVFSCFARRDAGTSLPLSVRLESKTGTVYAQQAINTLSKNWQKFTFNLQPSVTDPDARLVIQTTGVGAVALDMVSLFPKKTFHNRPNGLRADLAQVIADLKPRFVRFPGGCLAHGDGINNIYNWKSTIGPIERRKAQPNDWGYHQTTGLGYFEYFQFCEDIGAKPLPVVAAGVSCQFRGGGQQCIPLENMDEYVQDVLDLIEYANGPATSTWGAKRAAAGHPEPFHLKYLGVGNEDAQTPEFRERFTLINNAIKARYPDITVIGTAGIAASGYDFDEGWKLANQLKLAMVDEHYYVPPRWFLDNTNRYDKYDRAQSKVYLGEYASQGNTLFNALSEAAYMAALERNGDVVHLASYAPLLAKTGHTQWNPDLIYFDNTSVAPTVNYYVQQLYGQNAGDTYLPNTVSYTPAPVVNVPSKPVGVFLGTWNTQAEFDNVRVESAGTARFGDTFDAAAPNWATDAGAWSVGDGVYRQTAGDQPALAKVTSTQVSPVNGKLSYTYTVRARKTGGQEGFLIGFGAKSTNDYYWWNLGGWNNTLHAVEKHDGGGSTLVGKQVPGKIETGRWYDIRIVVTELAKGQRIQCFLDGKLVQDVVDDATAKDLLVASSVQDQKTGDVILKLVNVSTSPVQSSINLNGLPTVKPGALATVLSGDPKAVNNFAQPRQVVPTQTTVTVGKSFSYLAPPHSFTVIRMKTR